MPKTSPAKLAYLKAWRTTPNGRAARAREAKRFREKYPELWAQIKQRYRERHLEQVRAADRERARARRAAKAPGIAATKSKTKRWRDAQYARIAGRPRPAVCGVCRGAIGGIVFDHSHSTGMFRGWICDRCNRVLGLVHDDPRVLRSLARYLKENPNGKADSSPATPTPLERLCAAG